MFLVKRDNSNKNFIIKGLITSIFLSAFIYLSYFNIEYKLLNTILGLLGIYFLLTIPKKSLFYAGFFSGILWFYWVGLSLRYYDLIYLLPLVVLAFAFAYGVLFYLFSILDKAYFRAILIFGFTFIEPLNFNWMKFELLFIDSYFGTSKEEFALVLLAVYMLTNTSNKIKLLALIPLVFAYESARGLYIDDPKAKISMPQMNVKQNLKWEQDYQSTLINKNFKHINKAILDNKDLIILPETSFPLVLNRSVELLYELSHKSYDIDIITGSLYIENNQIYNATYHFSNGEYTVAKKVILVPFGEKVPLPEFLTDLINDIFYDGAKDYASAKNPTDFTILGEKFRNAICYEATTDKIFENLDDTRYLIAISNNAWFTPSIEPTLQNLLLKYYSKKYDITIFHIANGSENKIFRP